MVYHSLMAWNLFCDPQVDCVERRGTSLSHDFGLPRIWSSSAVQSGGLDFLHSSSGTSFSSARALGLISNGSESPDPLAPQFVLTRNDPLNTIRLTRITNKYLFYFRFVKYLLYPTNILNLKRKVINYKILQGI